MNAISSYFLLIASIFAIAFPALVMLFFLIKLVVHSRRIKMNPSADNLIGMIGRAESDIANEGLVFVRGELWQARSVINIQRGATVRVMSFSELALEVETLPTRMMALPPLQLSEACAKSSSVIVNYPLYIIHCLAMKNDPQNNG